MTGDNPLIFPVLIFVPRFVILLPCVVDGGHRAIVFNRLSGVKEGVMAEGMHFIIPWFEWPYIYDVRTKPRNVQVRVAAVELGQVLKREKGVLMFLVVVVVALRTNSNFLETGACSCVVGEEGPSSGVYPGPLCRLPASLGVLALEVNFHASSPIGDGFAQTPMYYVTVTSCCDRWARLFSRAVKQSCRYFDVCVYRVVSTCHNWNIPPSPPSFPRPPLDFVLFFY